MEEAAARKARLKAMREAAEAAGETGAATLPASGKDSTSAVAAPAAAEPEKPVLKFRNYQLRDVKKIEHEQLAPAQPPKFQEPAAPQRLDNAAQQDVLINVAPKKANWDLKRDVQPKLDKLERRTQRALIQILQEEERRRLQEEGGVQD